MLSTFLTLNPQIMEGDTSESLNSGFSKVFNIVSNYKENRKKKLVNREMERLESLGVFEQLDDLIEASIEASIGETTPKAVAAIENISKSVEDISVTLENQRNDSLELMNIWMKGVQFRHVQLMEVLRDITDNLELLVDDLKDEEGGGSGIGSGVVGGLLSLGIAGISGLALGGWKIGKSIILGKSEKPVTTPKSEKPVTIPKSEKPVTSLDSVVDDASKNVDDAIKYEVPKTNDVTPESVTDDVVKNVDTTPVVKPVNPIVTDTTPVVKPADIKIESVTDDVIKNTKTTVDDIIEKSIKNILNTADDLSNKTLATVEEFAKKAVNGQLNDETMQLFLKNMIETKAPIISNSLKEVLDSSVTNSSKSIVSNSFSKISNMTGSAVKVGASGVGKSLGYGLRALGSTWGNAVLFAVTPSDLADGTGQETAKAKLDNWALQTVQAVISGEITPKEATQAWDTNNLSSILGASPWNNPQDMKTLLNYVEVNDGMKGVEVSNPQDIRTWENLAYIFSNQENSPLYNEASSYFIPKPENNSGITFRERQEARRMSGIGNPSVNIESDTSLPQANQDGSIHRKELIPQPSVVNQSNSSWFNPFSWFSSSSQNIQGNSSSNTVIGSSGSDNLSETSLLTNKFPASEIVNPLMVYDKNTQGQIDHNLLMTSTYKTSAARLEKSYWQKLLSGKISLLELKDSFSFFPQPRGSILVNNGMPIDINALVMPNMQDTGLSEDYYRTLAYVESGGDPNAVSSTGATGLFQFTEGTAREYGLLGDNFDNRRDPNASFKAVQEFTTDNITSLQSAGIPVNDVTTYLSHQLGQGGVRELFSGMMGNTLSPEQIRRMELNTTDTFREQYGTVSQAVATQGPAAASRAYYDSWQSKWNSKKHQAQGVGGPQVNSSLPIPQTNSWTTNPNFVQGESELRENSNYSTFGRGINDASYGGNSIPNIRLGHENVDIENLQPGTVSALRQTQSMFGAPLIINSGYRSPEYNRQVGGAPNSQHIKGKAVDIDTSYMNEEQKAKLLSSALASGFTSVGFYPRFMHFDTRPNAATWGGAPGWAQQVMSSQFNSNSNYSSVTDPINSANSIAFNGTDINNSNMTTEQFAQDFSTGLSIGSAITGQTSIPNIGVASANSFRPTSEVPEIESSPMSMERTAQPPANTKISRSKNSGSIVPGGKGTGGSKSADVDNIMSQVEDLGLSAVLTQGIAPTM